jgi:hypothetical protein
MAFDPIPTALFPGWTEDGTDITLPIADLPELTAAEADAATGDSRKIIYAFLEQFYAWYNGLAIADRPSRITISRGTNVETSPGLFTRSYTFQVVTESGAPLDVADE